MREPPSNITEAEVRTYKRNPSIAEEERILLGHRTLIDWKARQIFLRSGKRLELEDAQSEGFFILKQALEEYSPELAKFPEACKFKSFAATRLGLRLKDYCRTEDPASRTSRKAKKLLDGAADTFLKSTGRRPTERELAAALGLNIDELKKEQRRAERVPRINRMSEFLPGTDDLTLGKTLIAEWAIPVQLQLELRDLIKRISQALSDRERRMLILCALEDCTLRELGEIEALSESRCSQVLKGARYRVKPFEIEFRELQRKIDDSKR